MKTNESITINSNDLMKITIAARIWFKSQNKLNKKDFKDEIEMTKKLKEDLMKSSWTYDAELMIMEVPF